MAKLPIQEFIVCRVRPVGIGSPVGVVMARTKTEAARLGRQKFGPGTYAYCRPAAGEDPATLRWIRAGAPYPPPLAAPLPVVHVSTDQNGVVTVW